MHKFDCNSELLKLCPSNPKCYTVHEYYVKIYTVFVVIILSYLKMSTASKELKLYLSKTHIIS